MLWTLVCKAIEVGRLWVQTQVKLHEIKLFFHIWVYLIKSEHTMLINLIYTLTFLSLNKINTIISWVDELEWEGDITQLVVCNVIEARRSWVQTHVKLHGKKTIFTLYAFFHIWVYLIKSEHIMLINIIYTLGDNISFVEHLLKGNAKWMDTGDW